MRSDDCQGQLERVWSEVHAGDLTVGVPEARALLESGNSDDRLRGLLLLRRHCEEGALQDEFFELAEPLIEDANNNCRWQALIVIGEFIPSRPDGVWRLIRRYGQSEDDDMRSAVATILLEHLLEHHTKYDQAVRRVARSSALFADTLSRCADFRKDGGQPSPARKT